MPAVKWPNKAMAELPTTLGKKMTKVQVKNHQLTKAKKPAASKNLTKVTTKHHPMMIRLTRNHRTKSRLAQLVKEVDLNLMTDQEPVQKAVQPEAADTKVKGKTKADQVVTAKAAIVQAQVAVVQVAHVQVVQKNK